MKASHQGTKPADPQLESGRPAGILRPFGVPRWIGAIVYVLFSFVLVLPLVRRWRRKDWWKSVRLVLIVAGAALALAWGAGWLGALPAAIGAVALICGMLLSPLADPDGERKLQRKHRADYLLNGGVLAGGTLSSSEPLGADRPLYLLIRAPHMMVVPQDGDGEVHSAIDIRRIERIEVGGELYVPIYVSEAKDPPVREESVDQSAWSDLELTMDDGTQLWFRYQGAFHKHLAETAAHGIYSVRESLCGGDSAGALHVLNRPGT
jgi:hypothetical protein